MQFTGYSRLGVFLTATLVCTQINAQESYRSEVGIAHATFKFDDIDAKANGIIGRFHFSAVNSNGLPLAESSFLTRTGSASITLVQSETSGHFNTFYNESESSGYRLEFDLRQKDSPNTVAARFGETESDNTSQPINATHNQTVTSFTVGRYFSDTFHVELGFLDININDHVSSGNDINSYSVSTKYIKQFDDSTAYNLEAKLERTSAKDDSSKEENTMLGFEADYYFNHRFNIGGGASFNRGDDQYDEGERLTLITNYFFSPHIGIELQAAQFYAKQAEGTDDESLDLLATLRF